MRQPSAVDRGRPDISKRGTSYCNPHSDVLLLCEQASLQRLTYEDINKSVRGTKHPRLQD
jgi:hypothetical protein